MKILYLKTENPVFRDFSYYDSIIDAPIRNDLLEFTKNNLTSEKLGEYLINASRIFFKG